MLKHADVWRAIDELAATYGFSPSGLAREAGLDATTFNISKRSADGGKKRWPSTESISKILEVTDASFMEFAALVARTSYKNTVDVLPLAIAGKPGHFDADGRPQGKGWGRETIAGCDDEHAFGIRVNGKALEPAYRQGCLLIASPSVKAGKGDRVAVVTADGALSIREVTKVSGKTYELTPLGKGAKLIASLNELRLLAKIALIVE